MINFICLLLGKYFRYRNAFLALCGHHMETKYQRYRSDWRLDFFLSVLWKAVEDALHFWVQGIAVSLTLLLPSSCGVPGTIDPLFPSYQWPTLGKFVTLLLTIDPREKLSQRGVSFNLTRARAGANGQYWLESTVTVGISRDPDQTSLGEQALCNCFPCFCHVGCWIFCYFYVVLYSLLYLEWFNSFWQTFLPAFTMC